MLNSYLSDVIDPRMTDDFSIYAVQRDHTEWLQGRAGNRHPDERILSARPPKRTVQKLKRA